MLKAHRKSKDKQHTILRLRASSQAPPSPVKLPIFKCPLLYIRSTLAAHWVTSGTYHLGIESDPAFYQIPQTTTADFLLLTWHYVLVKGTQRRTSPKYSEEEFGRLTKRF
eukprot:TCONS_00041601-protein